jgi:hypothetical protein
LFSTSDISRSLAFAQRFGLAERSSMPLFHTMALVVVFASAVSLSEAAAPVLQNANIPDMDRSIKPGADFYRYGNGGWLKTVEIW